jgi:dimethylaniline monooxygenase (N-oxide forming)
MTALKEFRSLGYDVTVFEKKDDVGGVWNWSENTDATTALKETKLCNNKYSVSDLPYITDATNTFVQVTLGDYPVPKGILPSQYKPQTPPS